MITVRFVRCAAGSLAATALADCIGSAFATPRTLAPLGLAPRELRPIGLEQIHGVPNSNAAKSGIYVSTPSGIFGYSVRNRHNRTPRYMVSGSSELAASA